MDHVQVSIGIQSYIPWPNEIIIHQIITDHFRTEHFRTENITKSTSIGVNVDQHWTTLEEQELFQYQ